MNDTKLWSKFVEKLLNFEIKNYKEGDIIFSSNLKNSKTSKIFIYAREIINKKFNIYFYYFVII